MKQEPTVRELLFHEFEQRYFGNSDIIEKLAIYLEIEFDKLNPNLAFTEIFEFAFSLVTAEK